jgi:hypothetical protein
MEFGLYERLLLLQITAASEGNLVTLRVVRDLRAALGFDESELAAANIQQDGNTLRWKQIPNKEISVGPVAKQAVVAAFKRLEAGDKLTMEMLPVYERFLVE